MNAKFVFALDRQFCIIFIIYEALWDRNSFFINSIQMILSTYSSLCVFPYDNATNKKNLITAIRSAIKLLSYNQIK